MQKQDNDNHSLTSLMRKAQSGDKTAYSSLFARITPILRSFISQKINNPDDVEDIVQEVMISIHKAGHTYDADRPFEVWMYTIARYRLNDHLRGYYKNESLREKIWDESEYLHNDPYVTSSTDIDESISEMIEALPAKQRTIVTMMKVEGYTAKETAEMVNMSETAVKVAAHRVYKKLAEKLRKSEYKDEN